MPDVTPGSPDEFAPFNSEFEHVKAHRALERVVEGLTNTGVSGVAPSQVGSGGATIGTTSTAAVVKGIYRTAAPIAVAVPAIQMLGITTVNVVQTFSVETQIGNAIQVGDPVVIVPTTAIPTNTRLAGAWCSDTNSITVAFVGQNAATVTLTFTTHVFTFDLT